MEIIENPDGSRIITNTIGTNGRDFSTLQAWADSIPSDLVAIKTKYVGLMYKDSVFTKGVLISNRTTSELYNIELRGAVGQRVRDNAPGHQGPVCYDASKGPAISYNHNGNWSFETFIDIRAPYTRVEDIQVKPLWGNLQALKVDSTAIGTVVNRCFFEVFVDSDNKSVAWMLAGTLENSLIFDTSNVNPAGIIIANGGTKLHNVGVVRSKGTTTKGVAYSLRYGKVELINCYASNFVHTIGNHGNVAATSSNNAGDSDDVTSTTYATKIASDQLQQANHTLANIDLRPKQGSVLLNAGKDLSDIKTDSSDIYGFARGTDWDIGPVENARPADKFLFTSTPTVGFTNEASASFVFNANGFLTENVEVVLVSDDPSGVFVPPTITLTPSKLDGSFTYTPSKSGIHLITLMSSGTIADSEPLSYLSGSLATKLLWHNTPSLSGRAGVDIPNVSVTVDGVVEDPVVITPTDSDGGVFTPATQTISKTNSMVTFAYKGASGGVKSITLSNDGGLDNPQPLTATLKRLIIAQPTMSTGTTIVKSIGAGKDFATVGDFSAYLSNLNLVELKQIVIGEVYENQTIGQYTFIYPSVADDNYYAVLQPVPGLEAFQWEETSDELTYSSRGIELTLGAFSIRFGRGLEVRNFRLYFPANSSGLKLQSASAGGNVGTPKLRHNQIKVSKDSGVVIETGEYATGYVIEDNLIIRDAGTGPIINPAYGGNFQRNTVAARGTGSFNTGAVVYSVDGSPSSVATSILRDNAFINTGALGVSNANLVNAANIQNNATDNALTTKVVGITEALPGSLVNSTTDYRPKTGGILEGTASTYAIDMPDIRHTQRGGLPDIGVVQGASRTPLPLVTITETIVDGQDIIINGTTKWAPTSATAILAASLTNPEGATTYGQKVVTLTDGKFTIKWEDVMPGNYDIPKITMMNAGGYNRTQSGGEVIEIMNAVADVIDGVEQLPTGSSPVIKVNFIKFDNSVLQINGTIDKQGDEKCTMSVFVIPLSGGDPIKPTNSINLVGNTWGVQFTPLKEPFKVRIVALANGLTTVYESNSKKIIDYAGLATMPVR